jgi:glycosyltransferase involved in cell wall biosynthesis
MRPSALQFLIPGELQSATGGYVYDRRVIDGLRALGWQTDVHPLDGSFPYPNAAALAHADRLLSRLPDAALVLIDGLALGAMPELIEAHAGRLVMVALVHMPLAAQFGLDPSLAVLLAQRELRALRSVRHVIVTSQATARQLTAGGLPKARLSVVEPGVDLDAALARRRYGGTLRLLCVATVSDGKGHELLIEALTPLTTLPWQLCCIGSLSRSPGTVERIRALLRRSGLESRVQLLDERPHLELPQYYCAADVFVLATQRETYCMAVAEALAHGLPIISTHTGAIAQLVGSDAGILVEPGDARALHAALARVLSQPALGQRLADAALIARQRLKSWTGACEEFAAVLAAVTRATAAASATERAG